MVDFQRARTFMVDNQLRTSGITDWRILARMSEVPREDFLPEQQRDLAYLDSVQWLGARGTGRFMPAPATLGKLIQLAEIAPQERVLIVGANTGYSAAVIAGLAAEVVGLEADATLAETARSVLARHGAANAEIIAGEVSAVAGREFDVVLVEGALDSVPQALLDRLADRGRLVALVRSGGVAVATVFRKSGASVTSRQEFNATLPSLFGAPQEPAFVF